MRPQPDRLREPEAGRARDGVGHQRRRRLAIQGFATDISVNKARRSTSRSTRPPRRSTSTSIGSATTAATARARSRRSPTCTARNQPACLTNSVDRPHRLRQLDRVGVVDGAGDRRLRHLPRAARRARHRRREPHRLRRPRRSARRPTSLFQTSDTTWQAYNQYGGNSLYVGGPGHQSRPRLQGELQPPVHHARRRRRKTGCFNAEYPMVRWLEANGYDVSYISRRRHRSRRRDRAAAATACSSRSATTSTGRAAQRANVEAARDAGVNLAFFSGNEVFWKTRWENEHRRHATRRTARWSATRKRTPTRRSIRTIRRRGPARGAIRAFSPPADGGRPENALTGTIFTVNCCTRRDHSRHRPAFASQRVLAQHARRRRSPPAAARRSPPARSATSGTRTSTTARARPGLMHLSSTTVSARVSKLLDYGSTYGTGTATHSLTLYRHAQRRAGVRRRHRAVVVGPRQPPRSRQRRRRTSPMQQATVNLFADMGVQPATLQAGARAGRRPIRWRRSRRSLAPLPKAPHYRPAHPSPSPAPRRTPAAGR